MKYFKFLAVLIPLLAGGISCAKRGDAAMNITSPAFSNNQAIPEKYTCQGQDVNPQLDISGIPDGTKSLSLIVDDPDAPMGTWVHWVVFNIPPTTTTIAEDSVPGAKGWNDFQRGDWGGPCPPSGTHRYFFKIYALDIALRADGRMAKKDLERIMTGHILAQGQLIGLYKKH